MSDRNPPVKPVLLARGRIHHDLFSHVFDQVLDQLTRLGVRPMAVTGMTARAQLEQLVGKNVEIVIRQVPDR